MLRLQTSLASSISKPVYSPLSAWYPKGGNSELKPTTNDFLESNELESSAQTLLVIDNTNNEMISNVNNFLKIIIPPLPV